MQEIILNSFFIGKSYIYLPSCHSTNEYLKEMTELQQPQEGMLILTDFQEKGRGQRGTVWESKVGENLMFSFLLKPKFLLVSEQFYLNIILSLAVQDTIKEYLPKVKVKWANDILYDYKKLCGILIENSIQGSNIQQSIIGVGLNVNQSDFTNPNASSLKNELNQEINREKLLQNLVSSLEERYFMLKSGKKQELKVDYLSNLLGYQTYEFYKDSEGSFEGKILDIDEYGRLQVEKKYQSGKIYLYQFKEIEFLYNLIK